MLGAMQLFHGLDSVQLEQLLDRHRETAHQVDQVLVMEQDWGESLFLIRSGLAKVRTYTADGDEAAFDYSGDLVGDWRLDRNRASDRSGI